MSLPIVLLIGVIFIFEMGLLGLNHQWKKTVQTQLRINHCVGKKAHALRSSIEAIESHNDRIFYLRKLAAASILKPPVFRSIKLIIQIESKIQSVRLLKWRLTQTAWLVKRGCDSKKDLPHPLPSQPWKKQPADIFGPRPMIWGSQKKLFFIELSSNKRRSGAKIFHQNKKWRLKWETKEPSFLRASYGF